MIKLQVLRWGEYPYSGGLDVITQGLITEAGRPESEMM